MVEDFSAILSPEEILKRLADLTQSFPAMRAIRLLCTEGSPNAIVCLLYPDESDRHSLPIAREIGGFMYGGLPALTISPLADGFCCENRRDGKLLSHFCAKCRSIN